MSFRTLLRSVAVALTAGVALAASAPASAAGTVPLARWQYQLQGTVDTTVGAATYDIDGFDTPATTVAALHGKGGYAVCYLDAGTWENWRSDAAGYPPFLLGRSNGWAGEKWIDVRRLDVLGPILSKRLQMCKAKGFDAVEPDNVDGYANRTGFPLTYKDQLTFNRWLATAAHGQGLTVGLKNDVDQATDLAGSFDFSVNEQCHQYAECNALQAFLSAGKPVLNVEYSGGCPTPRPGMVTILKDVSLNARPLRFC